MITEQTIKSDETLASVTNAKSKEFAERINQLVKEVTDDGAKDKAVLMLARFDADETHEKSLQATGIVGNHAELVNMIAETMEISEEFQRIVLQAATHFIMTAVASGDNTTEPFTYN